MRPAGARQLRQRALGVLAAGKRGDIAQRAETAQEMVKINMPEMGLKRPFRADRGGNPPHRRLGEGSES